FLSLLLGEERSGQELVSATQLLINGSSWRQNVHDGFIPNTQHATVPVSVGQLHDLQLLPSQTTRGKGRKRERDGSLPRSGVTFPFSSFTYDGRYSNNAWLWETPDFLTKVTWDNFALVSPETADSLGLQNDTLITVKVGDKSITLPCYTMPGQARYSIALMLG